MFGIPVVMEKRGNIKDQLLIIQIINEWTPFVGYQVISSAVVPILKLTDKRYSYEADISVDSWNGIKNTFLMYCYAQADPRVKLLTVIVKLWAEKARIKGARFHRLSGNHGDIESINVTQSFMDMRIG